MTTEESISAGINQTPIGRLGKAEEVAKTIVFGNVWYIISETFLP